jgi:arylsulfatase A-like enzyme
MTSVRETGTGKSILLIAAWAGVFTGLVEGISSSVLRWTGGLTWKMQLEATSAGILWFAPLLYFFGFSVIGLFLVAIGRMIPRLPAERLAVFGFGVLLFFDALSVPARIVPYGALALGVGLAVVVTRWFSSHLEERRRLCRRTLPWIAAVAVLAFVGVEEGQRLMELRAAARLPPTPPEAPNVVFIVLDTVRADHLSSYGYSRETSPNLDRLAKQGVLFEKAFSTSSWTLPSHASLLTGRYPFEHGAETKNFDGRVPTIAEVLSERGYLTACFSANVMLFTRTQGFGKGFLHFADYFGTLGSKIFRTFYGRHVYRRVLLPSGWEDLPGRKHGPEVTREFLSWVDSNRGRPFFAVLNYFDAHDPYLPPQPFRSRFSKLPNPGGIINSYVGRDYPKMTPEEFQGEIDAYDGAIAYVDHAVGLLLQDLEARGLLDNTIVFITADHGESLGEHGLLVRASSLYRELIHVPLIVRWPKGVPAGLRIEVPVSNAEIPATILELIGAGQKETFRAPSLVPLWGNPEVQKEWPYPLSELAKMPYEGLTRAPNFHGAIKSLVSPKWHYIVHEKFGEELYDWANDPAQENNLATKPEGANIAKEFARILKDMTSVPAPVRRE